jgi:excinuclease UvrABC ATPase subunit
VDREKTTGVEEVIVKLQMSLATSDDGRRVLVYNEDRSFTYEGGCNQDMIDSMKCGCADAFNFGEPQPDCSNCEGSGCRNKAYFEAHLTPEGLVIGKEVDAKSW